MFPPNKVNDDLLDAAMRCDTHTLEKALTERADPNAPRDMYKLTPLHYSAHHGNVKVVDLLLSSKANVLAQDIDGHVPLYRALLLGHTQVAQALLQAIEKSDADFSEHFKTWTVHEKFAGDLTAAAMESPPDGKAFHSADFILRMATWEANHLQRSQK